jgi:glycosyltransferase involved in cell wall biosynthesis
VEWNREKWNRAARLLWRAATWLATRVADVTVCDSNVVRNYFEHKYDTEMLFVPYGAKPIQAHTDSYKQLGLQNRNYFLFVGRLVPEKGVDVLLEAYRLSGCTVPLVIVGGNDKDCEYVTSLQSKAVGDVRFLGFRYGAEYESILAHAKLYVTASKLEGTSPSLLAAMGAQVCCLVNGIPENRETGGNSVLYFDGSAEDLAQKLAHAAADPAETALYAKAGYDYVRKHYDWDVVTKRYVEAYWAAITSPSGVMVTHEGS